MKYRTVELFPFTKALHKFLIKEGYTHLTNTGYIRESPFFKAAGICSDGYALSPATNIVFVDGKEEKAKGLTISRERRVRLPKDPNDPTREEMLEQSHMVGKIEEILKVFGEVDDESYRDIHWKEEAPPDISISEKGVEFGINHERVSELYNNLDGIKFYLALDIKDYKDNRQLARKLKKGVAKSVKSLRIIRAH